MRPVLVRLCLVIASIAVVISCDSALPTAPTIGSSKDLALPKVTLDTPLVGTLINIGDSILVSARLHDDHALKSVTLVGYTVKGSVDLGTYQQTPRYGPVTAPASGSFRPGLRDTVVRRYLLPKTPLDTTVDSVIVRAYVTDSAGQVDSTSARVSIVAGPKVNLIDPSAGDSIPPGVLMSLQAHATQTDGVARISIHVQGDATWPTPLDTIVSQAYPTSPKDVTFVSQVRIPSNAPAKSKVVVTASAVDVNRNTGQATPAAVFIKSSAAAQPRVYQTVPAKMETVDSITVTAKGDAGIRFIGFVARDSGGTQVARDSVQLPAPYSSPKTLTIGVNLPIAEQGKNLGFTAFAIDEAGRIGYAIPSAQTTAAPSEQLAHADSALIVYGRTYQLPRPGVIADVAVDAARGDVFLSNLNQNLVEVWQRPSQSFAPNGIAVGSQPFGLFLASDTLLVANSGATTISRVMLGAPGSPPPASEDLASRIRTRNSFIFTLTFTRDPQTLQVRLVPGKVYSFSDRPEYVAESKGGRIYFSTKPTTFAPQGTVRWLDPKLPVPDARQIWQYAKQIPDQASLTFSLFNIDSASIISAPPNTNLSDMLVLWDHKYGQTSGVVSDTGSDPAVLVTKLKQMGSDADYAVNLDLDDLALTDTTFAAASGTRSWIAFGEGNTKSRAAARVFMVNDSASTDSEPQSITRSITVNDLMENASEKVFGIAVDSIGRQVASHGSNSYFAAADDPFQLRLEGMYDSFDNGAGIAFAQGAKGPSPATPYSPPYNSRLAFAATQSGIIQAVDVAYFVNRGTFLTKGNLYGPLRVTGPMPGDPSDVVFKLYGLSSGGLVVINLTAADIKPGP